LDVDAIKSDYLRDGVVRLRELLSPSELELVNEELTRYEKDVVPGLPTSEVVFESDGITIRNLWRLHEHSNIFLELGGRTDILKLMKELLNGEPELAAVQTFNKQAKVGSGVPPHQDNAYFCRTPPDVLTLWIALDPVTEENGPIYYALGSHLQGMRPHVTSDVEGNSRGLASEVEIPAGKLFGGFLDPGDGLLHHSQIIHYSGPNNSDKPRRGLLMVFRGTHAKIDQDLKAQYNG
jgi:phytanoyl-CoA hydroxylase